MVGKKISRRREEGRGAEGPGKPTRLLLQSNGEGEEELFCRKRWVWLGCGLECLSGEEELFSRKRWVWLGVWLGMP